MPVLTQKMTNEQFFMAVQDYELGMKERGILATLQAMPLGERFTVEGIAEAVRDGYPSILSGIRALESCGYLYRERIRDERGHVQGSEYRLYNDFGMR